MSSSTKRFPGKHPRSSATPAPQPPAHPAASMALIFDAMQHPLDPLYEDVAQARAKAGKSPAGSRTLLTVIAAFAIGLLLAIGGHALRVPAKVLADRHTELVKDIEAGEKTNDSKTREISTLRNDVAADTNGALNATSASSLKAAIAQGQIVAGLAPLSGAGLSISLANPAGNNADSSDSDPRTNASTNAVTSTDIQQIVNALWRAGARGIAINDQRITSLSAIRFAGSAVLVNYRPLTSPYTVTAVGADAVKTQFDSGFGGQYLKGMSNGGITVKESILSSTTLPAAATAQINYATAAK